MIREAVHLRFVDLFAGLGGFHVGLTRHGHQCVFACEIDEELRDIYQANFGIRPSGDIRNVMTSDIPSHDILCAGFPCQPYSKAGAQEGRSCPKWGNLFGEVLRILRHHRPKFFILENVPNLLMHDDETTWMNMYRQLVKCGYSVKVKLLSPSQFEFHRIVSEHSLLVLKLDFKIFRGQRRRKSPRKD